MMCSALWQPFPRAASILPAWKSALMARYASPAPKQLPPMTSSSNGKTAFNDGCPYRAQTAAIRCGLVCVCVARRATGCPNGWPLQTSKAAARNNEKGRRSAVGEGRDRRSNGRKNAALADPALAVTEPKPTIQPGMGKARHNDEKNLGRGSGRNRSQMGRRASLGL